MPEPSSMPSSVPAFSAGSVPRAHSLTVRSAEALSLVSSAPAELLFPQAYRGTITGGSRVQLPALKAWIWAFVLVLILLLVASVVLWRRAASELRAATEQALAPSNGSVPPDASSPPASSP